MDCFAALAMTPVMAFTRAGTDFGRVTGAQLIDFGAAAPLTGTSLRAALAGE